MTMEVLSTSNIGFSTVSVIVVLKRLKVYYYLNVFLQFLFLIGIGFMSLTFPVTNFTDRVMTALTVLLVMTCNQQVINVCIFETGCQIRFSQRLSLDILFSVILAFLILYSISRMGVVELR